ncbi:hypothetical protein M3A49_00995 [Paraburkholderia sp. CNPSo 3076]|uniref:hypothetical protein n=1 Tax=Paraburkholderia sp. CNPSo 3076 TaxID=2940936 RepID=UPI0022543130|nr:hypothetical protein [Paraburkholderia sp. CNPSo 3076]MCX5538088.1 hypothetical protein [Paraburkholderia sp. CNPSo 3076]
MLSKCQYQAGHNGKDFDFAFITHEIQRACIAVPQFNVIDTMHDVPLTFVQGSA